MKAIICFIIGFLLAKLVNYIKTRKGLSDAVGPKTLNIGDSDETIKVYSGMVVIEIKTPFDIQKFDLESMNDIIFYISGTDRYILYKDKDFKYVKLDVPIHLY